MSGAPSRDIGQYLNKSTTLPVSYKPKDLVTYAIAIGCDDERFVYRQSPNFQMYVLQATSGSGYYSS